MPSKLHYLGLSFLLLGITSCGGSQSQPEASIPEPPPQEQFTLSPTPESTLTPPQSEPLTSSPQKEAVSNPSVSSPPEVEKQARVPESNPPQEKISENLDPLPELSPENEKLVSSITDEVSQDSGVVTENAGLITMNRLLLAQQAQWLISGSFSTDFQALEPNLPQETNEYKFEITQGNEKEAIVQAIAKNDKLPSFTGASYAIPTGLPTSGLCQSKLPSQTSPTPPELNGATMSCGNDGVLVTD